MPTQKIPYWMRDTPNTQAVLAAAQPLKAQHEKIIAHSDDLRQRLRCSGLVATSMVQAVLQVSGALWADNPDGKNAARLAHIVMAGCRACSGMALLGQTCELQGQLQPWLKLSRASTQKVLMLLEGGIMARLEHVVLSDYVMLYRRGSLLPDTAYSQFIDAFKALEQPATESAAA